MEPETNRARLVWPLLLLVAAAGTIPRLWLAVHQYIEYDGWIHILVARQSSWNMFVREVAYKPHPPLFYLCLRAACAVGSSHLAYRAVSLIAGAGAVLLAGRAALRLTSNATLAILCAATMAFSMTSIVISCEVRSYMLMAFFVLAAYPYYLELASLRLSRRALTGFSLTVTLAIASHYSAAFFLLATIGVPMLLALLDRGYRTELSALIRGRAAAILAAFGLPLATFAAGYVLQIRRWSDPMNHLPEFYWHRAAEGLAAYLVRSMANLFNLFSPIAVRSAGAAPLVTSFCFTALAVAFALTLKRGRSGDRRAVITVALLLGLLLQLVVAGALGRYPFGGEMRHQYILFPLIVLSLTAMLGLAAGPMQRPSRAVVYTIVAAAVVANFIFAWRAHVAGTTEPGASDVAAFEQAVPGSRLIYADQYSALFLFIRHNDWRWTLEKTDPLDSWIETYRLERNGESIRVVRGRDQWQMDPSLPELPARLRGALDSSKSGSISVFWVRQPTGAASPGPDENAIRRRASAKGLDVVRLHSTDSVLFAEYRRRDPASP